MSTLGNILWFLTAGFWLGTGWGLAGLLWCVSLIGFPWGVQCFKFAALLYAPFGKEVVYGNGIGSLLFNIVWLLVSGLPLAISSLLIGILLCITIVGIPFGKQCFKYARLALMPFGRRIQKKV